MKHPHCRFVTVAFSIISAISINTPDGDVAVGMVLCFPCRCRVSVQEYTPIILRISVLIKFLSIDHVRHREYVWTAVLFSVLYFVVIASGIVVSNNIYCLKFATGVLRLSTLLFI